VVQTEERRGTWMVSVGKSEGKKPLGLKKYSPDKKIKKKKMDGLWYRRRRGEARGWFRWGNPKARNRLEDLGIDGRIILKRI